METAFLGNYDDIVTEIKNSLKQVEIEPSIQMHASKKEFKEILSKSSERSRKNQTIFCVIKLRRKPDIDERSGQSSPYIMFHSTKLFKKSELTNGTFPDLKETRHLSKTVESTTNSDMDHHHVKQSAPKYHKFVRRLKSTQSRSDENIWMAGTSDSFHSKTPSLCRRMTELELDVSPLKSRFQYYTMKSRVVNKCH